MWERRFRLAFKRKEVICYWLFVEFMEKESFKSFEDLECWKACTEVRRFITQLVEKYPKDERFAIVDNMKRAARSTTHNLAEDVIKTLDLITVLFEDDQDEQPTFQDAVRSLTDITEITDDKEGLISITVEYKAPRMAGDIANQYTIHHRTPTIPQ